jgi:hypothetical protein
VFGVGTAEVYLRPDLLGFGYAEVVRSPYDSLQKSKDLKMCQNSPLTPTREAEIRMTKALFYSRVRE